MTEGSGADHFDELLDDKPENKFQQRESIVFCIDARKSMHKASKSYFMRCLQTYQDIIRDICASNKKDQAGLIIFGTEDSNYDYKNIHLVQECKTVTLETMKFLEDMIEGNEYEKYKANASSDEFPIYNVLTAAMIQLNSIESNVPNNKRIIFCTNEMNPYNDTNSWQKINSLMKAFRERGIKLHVPKLSRSDDLDLKKYKIMMLNSRSPNEEFNDDEYLSELKKIVLKPSRSIYRLPWKISQDISVQIDLFSIIPSGNSAFPTKDNLKKEDNEILHGQSILLEKDNNQDDGDSAENNEESRIIENPKVIYSLQLNDVKVCFQADEHKKLKTLGLKPYIETLAMKPGLECDPILHCSSPYFASYSKTCTQESKEFFNYFVSACHLKKVTPICMAVLRTSAIVCRMVPSIDDGGFYLYEIPFFDDVLKLDNEETYIEPSEVEEAEEAKFQNLMSKSEKKFNIEKFKDPKLQKCISHLEALALCKVLSIKDEDEECIETPSKKSKM